MSRPFARHATLTVCAWGPGAADGVDARSGYVERFWLPVLGPSAAWLARRLADQLGRAPHGFPLDVDDTAHALGLGQGRRGRRRLAAAVRRLVACGVARWESDRLHVRVRLPLLDLAHQRRLPAHLRREHQYWSEHDAACARRPAFIAPYVPVGPVVGGVELLTGRCAACGGLERHETYCAEAEHAERTRR